MSGRPSGYRRSSRQGAIRAMTPSRVVETSCAITTSDNQMLISQRTYDEVSGIIVPFVRISESYEDFEEETLASDRLQRTLGLDESTLLANGEVLYLGRHRLIPPSRRKLVVPCGVEFDMHSCDIPLPQNSLYAWQPIDYVEDLLSTGPQVSKNAQELYDAHYTLRRYISTQTFILDA